ALAGREPDKTLRQLLDWSVAEIDRRQVPFHPRPQSAIRHAMGTAYYDLGRLDDAEQQLRKAVKLREEWGGVNHVAVADSLKVLGPVLAEQGRIDEALAVLRRARDLLRADSFRDAQLLTT